MAASKAKNNISSLHREAPAEDTAFTMTYRLSEQERGQAFHEFAKEVGIPNTHLPASIPARICSRSI
jgi:hypothetical protein